MTQSLLRGIESKVHTTYKNAGGNSSNESKEMDLGDEQMAKFMLHEKVLRHFCLQIQIALSSYPEHAPKDGDKDKKSMPILRAKKWWRVIPTSILYFRRFYLFNNMYSHDPRIVMCGAINLAAKVEESRISETELMNIYPHLTTADLKTVELNLLVALNNQLFCYHPLNLIQSMIADMKSVKVDLLSSYYPTEKGNEEAMSQYFSTWLTSAQDLLLKVNVTQAVLIYKPMHIACAVLSFTEQVPIASEVTEKSKKKSKKTKSSSDDDIQITSNILSSYVISKFGEDAFKEVDKSREAMLPFVNQGVACARGEEAEEVRVALKEIRKASAWYIKKERQEKSNEPELKKIKVES